jgi:hypothetical protein
MPVLSLPLSFNNSFWTQDYRKGLEVLYTKLEQVRLSTHVFRYHDTHVADLPQGASENDEIIAFIRVRSTIIIRTRPTYSFLYRPERRQRRTSLPRFRLLTPPPRVSSPTLSCGIVTKPFTSGTGFSADDGATLLMAFRGIQAETSQQGGAHKSIARELHHLVADPFEGWAKGYHVGHADYHTSLPSTDSLS